MSNTQKMWIWSGTFVVFFIGVYVLRDGGRSAQAAVVDYEM